MEGELLKLLRQTKEAGGSASLTFTTRDGKMKAKLEVELDPPAPASPSSTPPPPTTSPAPGRGRRRRKGAAAKVKAKARAALHQATQAAATHPPPAPGDASVPLVQLGRTLPCEQLQEEMGCHCHDRLTAISHRQIHLPPHYHLRALSPTGPTAPTGV